MVLTMLVPEEMTSVQFVMMEVTVTKTAVDLVLVETVPTVAFVKKLTDGTTDVTETPTNDELNWETVAVTFGSMEMTSVVPLG